MFSCCISLSKGGDKKDQSKEGDDQFSSCDAKMGVGIAAKEYGKSTDRFLQCSSKEANGRSEEFINEYGMPSSQPNLHLQYGGFDNEKQADNSSSMDDESGRDSPEIEVADVPSKAPKSPFIAVTAETPKTSSQALPASGEKCDELLNGNKNHCQEIELGIWPKLVHTKAKESLASNGRSSKKIEATNHRQHEEREFGCRDQEESNVCKESGCQRQLKTTLPIRSLVSSEFGHLGFRDHWMRMIDVKGKRAESEREVRNMYEEEWRVPPENYCYRNWGFSGGMHCAYYGAYRADRGSMPRYCWPLPGQEYPGVGARHTFGAFGRHITMAAEKFRQELQRRGREEPESVCKKRSYDNAGKVKKHELFWPEVYEEKLKNQEAKVKRMSTTSPCLNAERPADAQDRPYNCTICDKTFKRRSSLATHKFIHTDLKPHVCSICSKRFLRKSDLKKHGLMHSGRKPYQCEKCGRRFSQSSNMLTHLRRHMGIRPFDCSICGRSFFRKVDLKRHEGRHLAKKLKTRCVEKV